MYPRIIITNYHTQDDLKPKTHFMTVLEMRNCQGPALLKGLRKNLSSTYTMFAGYQQSRHPLAYVIVFVAPFCLSSHSS